MSATLERITRDELERVSNPFTLLVQRYARRPRLFVQEVLGADPDPWQAEMLDALGHGHKRLTIRSGHGVGKSTGLSWAILWFVLTRFPVKVMVTAPSAPQLFDALWVELKAWLGKLPVSWQALLDPTSDRISLRSAPDEAFVSARTSRAESPDALQGVHSANVMLVVDEAAGVPESVYEAAGGSMSTPGAITILAGNPTKTSGMFHRTHTLERDRWWTRRVSSLESKRVDPAYAEEIAQRYGVESNRYRIRVLGEFPLSEGDTLISATLVEQAMERIGELDMAQPEIWGVDVARFGPDASVLIKRRGFVVTEPPRRWYQQTVTSLAGGIFAEYQRAHNNPPAMVCVDTIGIGGGVADLLREMKVPTTDVNVSERESVSGRYARMRDELWQLTADWFATQRASLPYDEDLRDDLVGPKYGFLSDGRLKVESKDEMKRRGRRSPDSADALIHTFCPAAITAAAFPMIRWNEPIRRNLKGIV